MKLVVVFIFVAAFMTACGSDDARQQPTAASTAQSSAALPTPSTGLSTEPAATTTDRPDAQTRPFAVYLQPVDTNPDTQLDIPAMEAALGDLPFVTVSTADDFVATVDAAKPFSIWIHSAAIDSIPSDWINTHVRQGTPIVGIDLSFAQLNRLIPMDDADPFPTPPGHVTFVTYSEQRDASGDFSRESGRSQGYIRDVHHPYRFIFHAVAYVRSSLQHLLEQPDADLSDIPPVLMPEPIDFIPPELLVEFTPEQEANFADIALTDPRVVAALDGHPHHVDSIGSWTDRDGAIYDLDGNPIFASVEIRLDGDPAQITGDWLERSPPSCVITDLRGAVTIEYRATAQSLWGMYVHIDPDTGDVVGIYPAHSTTEGDPWLDPPVYSSEHTHLPCPLF